MDKTVDMLHATEKIEQLADMPAGKAQLAYTIGAGMTCMLAMGIALCAHVGFEAILGSLKPGAQEPQLSHDADEGESASVREAAQAGPDDSQGSSADDTPASPHAASADASQESPFDAPQSFQRATAHMRAALRREPFANETVKRFYTLQLEELAKYRLSGTEQRIAALILHGEPNKYIAERMHLAESTIKKHVQRILSKTGTTNRKEFAHMIQEQVERRPL